MAANQATQILILISAMALYANIADAHPRICGFNRAKDVGDGHKCDYGWEMDPCGVKVCTKGTYLTNLSN